MAGMAEEPSKSLDAQQGSYRLSSAAVGAASQAAVASEESVRNVRATKSLQHGRAAAGLALHSPPSRPCKIIAVDVTVESQQDLDAGYRV